MGSNSYIKSVFRALSEIPDGPYADHNASRYGNGSIKGLGAYRKEDFVGRFFNSRHSQKISKMKHKTK